MAGDDSLTHKEYCPVCHNFEPTGLVAERDQGVRDQYGPGRLALEGREPKEFENSKCEDCNLLLQAANELSQHKWEWLAIWLEKGNNPRVSLDSSEHGNVSFELYSPDESYGRMPSLPEIPPGPECPESIQFINERMNDCREHPSCRPPQFVPKRLYQISKSRIIEPESYVPYCALSYCWGKALTLKTTTTNHDRFKEWMDHREFPVCFTDASTVAQRLNVDYIWIDALCIVQDDRSDWEHQYPLMGDIYEGAQLVIAAGSSENCRESFLSPNRSRPISLTHSDNGRSIEVRARRILSTGLHEDYETFYSRRDHLDRRAWPLQERLLATRLLVYTSAELQWQCRTTTTICEGGHRDSAYRATSSLYSLEPSNAYGFWHLQIMEYSKRLLTYQHDKLPALAGIAAKISVLTGSEYIAGLWRKNLLKDMLWERHIFEGLKWEATSVWRAPSFSWASVQGNVFYGEIGSANHGVYLTEVVDAKVTPSIPGSPFGVIKHGEVTVRGPLLEATIRTPPDWEWDRSTSLFHVERGTWRVRLRSDTHLRQGPIIADDGSKLQENTAYRTTEDTRTTINECKVWILIAARWVEHSSDGGPDRIWFNNLFLGKSKRIPGAFERLGHNNQPWPLSECNIEGDQYNELDDIIFGRGKVQEIKIV